MRIINLCFVLFGLILSWQSCGAGNHGAFFGSRLPSDDALKADFKVNKGKLEQLKAMFQEDRQFKSIRVFSNEVNFYLTPKLDRVYLPEVRFQEYKKLAAESNILIGAERDSEFPGAVFLIVDSADLGTLDGSQTMLDYKGFVFSEKEISPIMDSLDNPEAVDKGIAFKKLENNWYLFYKQSISKPE